MSDREDMKAIQTYLESEEFDYNDLDHIEGKAIMGAITFGVVIIGGFVYYALYAVGVL